MQECPECGIVLPEDLWAVGESCPVCNPYKEDLELLGGIFRSAIDEMTEDAYDMNWNRPPEGPDQNA